MNNEAQKLIELIKLHQPSISVSGNGVTISHQSKTSTIAKCDRTANQVINTRIIYQR
jgi:hypothetical protein